MMDPEERIIWDKIGSSKEDWANFALHLGYYFYAMQFVLDKTVLDAGCGTGYGSWLLSLGAKALTMVDINQEALDYSYRLPFICPIQKICCDLSTYLLPIEYDICIAIESIDHLADPDFFLKNLKTKELIFSFPLGGGYKYHKKIFHSRNEVVDYLFSFGFELLEGEIRYQHYFLGRAIKS